MDVLWFMGSGSLQRLCAQEIVFICSGSLTWRGSRKNNIQGSMCLKKMWTLSSRRWTMLSTATRRRSRPSLLMASTSFEIASSSLRLLMSALNVLLCEYKFNLYICLCFAILRYVFVFVGFVVFCLCFARFRCCTLDLLVWFCW